MFRQNYKDFIFFVLCGVVGGVIVLNSEKILSLRPSRGHTAVRKRPRNNKLRTSDPTGSNRNQLYKR